MALVSATTYVACGSSDNSLADQEAGASGEAGDANDSGGSKSTAGSSGVAGTKSSAGGDSSNGGAPGAPGGEGGLAGSSLGGGGGSAGDEPVGGDAGAAGAPAETGLPAACPGVIADYTLLEGGDEPDTFTSQQLNGKILARGQGSDDIFESNTGQDCLVGGPGDDEFTSASEGVSYFVGGAGADSFHLTVGSNNYTRIADMTAEDTIGLSKATFAFLAGTPGATPFDTQVFSVAESERRLANRHDRQRRQLHLRHQRLRPRRLGRSRLGHHLQLVNREVERDRDARSRSPVRVHVVVKPGRKQQ
jgi:hypothetical protein